jgi:hypothetical protein
MTSRKPTLRLDGLTGVWVPVYRERDRLEADADEQVIAAWRDVARGLDLSDVIDALRDNGTLDTVDPESAALRRQHLQRVTMAAILARFTTLARLPGWADLIGALAAALRRARAVGQQAGHAVVDDDPTVLDDVDDIGDDDADTADAYDIAAAALRGLARTVALGLVAGAIAGAEGLAAAAAAAMRDGLAWTLAVSTGVGLAFTSAMASAYLSRGIEQLDFVTAGDAAVCTALCAAAEDGNPYLASAAPGPPLHPHCRCTLQPTQSTT